MKVEEWDAEASRPLVSLLRAAVYPPEALATIVWRNVTSAGASRRILVREGDEVVATAGFLWRDGQMDGKPVVLGGLGGVMTKPELQGHGRGRIAVQAAMKSLPRKHSPSFGVLFCEQKNVGFYSRLGWRCFDGEVLVEQPSGIITYSVMRSMVTSLLGQAPMSGRLDLCGLPW